MGKSASVSILRVVRREVGDLRSNGASDSELLGRFRASRDEAAFQELVLRHGPMVLSVCRALLRCEADAEDACQATFLVLARKAGSVRRTNSLASWLHGVAYRVARKAQSGLARRHRHEERAARPEAAALDDPTWREVQVILHAELAAMSARYRGPLTLCYLQGRTLDSAAAELGLAKSTLKNRLERGREVLRARLVRRGLGSTAVLVAAAWPETGSATIPATLGNTMTRMAIGGAVPDRIAALTRGVMNAMIISKFKVVAIAAALVLAVGLTLTSLGQRTTADEPRAEPAPKPVAMKRDRVKDRHGEEWVRITGKVAVIDARTLLFEDGTRVTLDYIAPELNQLGLKGGELYACGKDAAEFLRTLIGERPVTCVRNVDREREGWIAHVGDTAIDQAMLINGWAFADDRAQQAPELTARDAKRGLWAGKFVTPSDWRAGVRLPGEAPPPRISGELEAQQLIEAHGRSEPALSTVVARIVNDLPHALHLRFFSKDLRDEHLAQICRLTELEELHIGSTNLTPLGLAHLKQLRQLKFLAVHDSSPAALAQIEGLTSLKHLVLTSNATDDSLAHVAKLTELEFLNLSWAPISDAGLNHLKGLRNLHVLRLGYAHITDDGLRHLKDMANLRRLDLYNTKITGAALAHLSGLKNLRQLDLHQTRVNNAGLAHLAGLDKLEYIDLNHDDISDAAVEHLVQLKGLKVIQVEGLISDQGKARLREVLPNLRFEKGSLGPR